MAGSPTVRRRRLAVELRRLREAAGLTIDEAAAAADISKSAVSRIENALVAAKPPAVRALAHAYKVHEAKTEALVQLAREANQRGWWQLYGDVLSEQVAVYIGFEAEAASIREYEPLVLPGLLQTAQYAQTIFGGYRKPRTEEEVARRTGARIKRQERLEELDLWFIIEESALTRRIGGVDVMREQLARVVAVSQLRNVTLQIIPHDAGAHPGLDGPFSIFEFAEEGVPAIAYTETPAGEIWLDKTEELRRLSRTFDQLRAVALSVEASRQVVTQILEELQ